MVKKALFYDVDGTLLSEIQRVIPESAKNAISQARKLGHLVFINSGRTYCLLSDLKQMVETDGLLCGCGTRIIVGDQVLYSAGISHERGIQIKKDLIRCNMDAVLEGTENCYFQKQESRFPLIEKMKKFMSKDGIVSVCGWDESSYDFDKLCAMADGQSHVEEFLKAMSPDIDVIDRGDSLYECVPAGHSKATAIEFIIDKFNISLDHTYVFGDSTNDLSMFQFARHSVLMGKHDKELEQYATFQTKTVEEDGIWYAMKELEII